jgi:hypothetical protein
MPSIAEMFTSGTEYFAYTGVATTLPMDLTTGTFSVLRGAGNDDFIWLSACSREQSDRYRFTIAEVRPVISGIVVSSRSAQVILSCPMILMNELYRDVNYSILMALDKRIG